MRSLQDMSLLLLSGFLFLFDREPEYTFIMAFLFGVILCCLGYFSESRRLHCVLCLLFLGSAVFLPAFCCFSSAAVYILLREHSRPALAFGLIFYGVSLCRYSERPFFFSAWSLLILLTAFFWNAEPKQSIFWNRISTSCVTTVRKTVSFSQKKTGSLWKNRIMKYMPLLSGRETASQEKSTIM